MAAIRCGKCKETHQSVEAVKACYAGATVGPGFDFAEQVELYRAHGCPTVTRVAMIPARMTRNISPRKNATRGSGSALRTSPRR